VAPRRSFASTWARASTTTTTTALGDAVNTAARLASAAGPGEILVTSAAVGAAGLDENLERRTLELKGKQDFVDVVSVTVRPAVTAG
jgi:adenylate cyclase